MFYLRFSCSIKLQCRIHYNRRCSGQPMIIALSKLYKPLQYFHYSRGITSLQITMPDKGTTAENHEGMEIGGPRSGATDLEIINVGPCVRVFNFHPNDEILVSNIVEMLPRTGIKRGGLILEVVPDEEIFCFIKERVQCLNGASSQ